MPESSLSLSYDDLRSEIAQLLGFSRTYTDWTTGQAAVIASLLNSGLRQFYFPPPAGGKDIPPWSFMQPVLSLQTTANKSDYDLPDDFGGFAGALTFKSDSNRNYSLPLIGEGMIRDYRARDGSVTTGRPRYAAVRPKPIVDGQYGQRYELLLYEAPDAAYTLQGAYTILPSALSTTNRYPYGGPVHAETILESCLACVEEKLDDAQGLHAKKFMERLAASAAHDAKLTRAGTLGYNGDYSDGQRQRRRHSDEHVVTYNNVEYGG